MWMPTHVQVTVQRASGLLIKGKNNTNDCFVTIGLGKTKYQTSIKEKAEPSVEWHEECELAIPDQGNTAEIVLTVLHRNFLGVDEFLGRTTIPLNGLDIYERPKNRWYNLQSKPGKEIKNKERGKLEVKVAFTVKSGSLTNLSKKEKSMSSIGQLSHMAQSVGGSLLSITSIEKRQGIKKFAKSIGSKMHLKGRKKDVEAEEGSSIGSVGSLKQRTNHFGLIHKSKQTSEDADPGVVSEDDEFTFDDLSHKSSGSSLNQTYSQSETAVSSSITSLEKGMDGEVTSKISTGGAPPAKPPRADQKVQDEWELKLYGKQSKQIVKSESLNRKSWESPKLSAQIEEEENFEPQQLVDSELIANSNKLIQPSKKEERESMLSKLKKIRRNADKHDGEYKFDKNNLNSNERIIIGGETDVKISSSNNKISGELLQKFNGKTREDLILLICDMQGEVEHYRKKMTDLEDYLDELLLRVMETTPKILQNPYMGCKIVNSNLI